MSNIDIKATPAFDRLAEKLMSKEALEGLLDHLVLYPESGIIISGTGGIRKVRWESGKNNRGKRGGVRILYYYIEELLIILMTVYGKSEKEDISDHEKNEFKRALPGLIEKYRGEII